MAEKQLFTNNAVSLLATPASSSATELRLMPGYGRLFPQPADPGDFFLVTLEDDAGTVREIIKVTDRQGDVLTGLHRAQEGTQARAWPAGPIDTLVNHCITAATIAKALECNCPQQPSGTGGSLYDQPFELVASANSTALTLKQPYLPGTLRVFIGGLRQKLNVDFAETSPTALRLNFRLTQADLDAGQNIVVDFDPF